MLFLRVIAWCGDEKFSLKKSCFYLYIRRRYESGRGVGYNRDNQRKLQYLCGMCGLSVL